MAVEIYLALRAEGIQHPEVEVVAVVEVASFVEAVVGWRAGVEEVAAAKSEFCTTLIWVTTHLIGRLGIRFRVSREIVNQGLPGTNCFGLPSLQRKLHPIALTVAVPESTFQPGGLGSGFQFVGWE